jgi:hypothetical protein
MRFSKPKALASDDAMKSVATATKEKIIRFMGRTPVPIGETLTSQQVTVYRLQLSEISAEVPTTFAVPEQVTDLPDVAWLTIASVLAAAPVGPR